MVRLFGEGVRRKATHGNLGLHEWSTVYFLIVDRALDVEENTRISGIMYRSWVDLSEIWIPSFPSPLCRHSGRRLEAAAWLLSPSFSLSSSSAQFSQAHFESDNGRRR